MYFSLIFWQSRPSALPFLMQYGVSTILKERGGDVTQKKQLYEKFKEAAASVLPIVIIVGVMCLTFIPMQADLMLSFIIGSVMLIVGMGLFTLGSDVSMTPIGSHMGAKLS